MNEDKIVKVFGRELLDSKGRPMVEVEVECAGGAVGQAAAPCGTSVGSYEAFVLRDHNARYGGLGTRKAVRNVQGLIATELLGKSVCDQEKIDKLLTEIDGTPDKKRLGANAIYSTSVAVARAAAKVKNVPLFKHLVEKNDYCLPIPMFNVVNGGVYGDVSCSVQEFMLIPTSAESFSEAYRMGVEVFYQIKKVIEQEPGSNLVLIGNSLGHAAPYSDASQNIDVLLRAIEEAGYKGQFEIGLDCAATHFYNTSEGFYEFQGSKYSQREIMDYWLALVDRYSLLFIEDPFHEDAFEAFLEITRETDAIIAGDDLFVTNEERLKRGINMTACNSIVFKPNMIGTVSEALQVATLAAENNYEIIPSIRSGGGVDDPIADFAVALGARLIKCGAPRSGERTMIQNYLLRLEEKMRLSFATIHDLIDNNSLFKSGLS